MDQAARDPASAPVLRSELKYRSSVFMAASRTKWQSAQVSRWRLISPSTEAESRPSKYQQIKWIVSLQLISPVPQDAQKRHCSPDRDLHFPRQIRPSRLKYYLLINQRFSLDYRFWSQLSTARFLKRLHAD